MSPYPSQGHICQLEVPKRSGGWAGRVGEGPRPEKLHLETQQEVTASKENGMANEVS